MWRVYQRGLERWIADLLQPVFDSLVSDGMVPRFVQVRDSGAAWKITLGVSSVAPLQGTVVLLPRGGK